MKTKEYIESGILEAYVLGTLSREEQSLVEANIVQYPELQDELNAIEATLQQYATTFTKEPPFGMQEKIWETLKSSSSNEDDGYTKATWVSKTLPLQPVRKTLDWKYAAVIALLISSVVLNFILYGQGSDERKERIAMNIKMEQMAGVVNDCSKANFVMLDTGMQKIIMQTAQPDHPMAATLYWSKAQGDAYVVMNALPEPPRGMQYQLWVIQHGIPVSMGILPNKMVNTPVVQKIPMQVTDGQAFAISLEKEGGSATPTTVYVIGNA